MAYEGTKKTFENIHDEILGIKLDVESLRRNFMLHLYEEDLEEDSKYVARILNTFANLERIEMVLDEYVGYVEIVFKEKENES